MKKRKKAKKCEASENTAPQDPMDAVTKLTSTELLKLGKISAEMRLEFLSARVAVFEGQDVKAKAEAELRSREAEIKAWAEAELKKKEEERTAHLTEARRLKAEYGQLTASLAEKYGIDDPSSMIVDPDTGVIRDSRNL